MLYSVNVILCKLLHKSDYLIGKFVICNFEKYWKQNLGFVAMCIGSCMQVTQKEIFCLDSWKQSQSVSDSFGNITIKIRFIHCKYTKAKQTYF